MSGPKMYPSCFIPVSHNEGGDKAEEAVYNALQNMPGTEDWIVLHNYRHTQFVPNQNNPWENYEVDFIVITPKQGFIVLEVKNWSDFVPSKNQSWELHMRDGSCESKKSPAVQADDAKRHIYNLLQRKNIVPNKPKNSSAGKRYNKKVEYRAAVVMYAQNRQQLNTILGADDQTYICRDELEPTNLKRHLLDFFTNSPESRYQYNANDILQALLPAMKFNMSFTEWADFMENAAAPINSLFPMLEKSTANMLIEGCAGSGKTVLASREARRLAEQHPDKKVLFLCYNGFLAVHLMYQSGMKDETGDPKNLDIMTINELCKKLTKKPDFYCDKDLTFAKVKELRKNLPFSYDYIFVDEGQDFNIVWWPLIQSLCHKRLHVFMDGNQALYAKAQGQSQTTIDCPIRIKLHKNLRNTDKITRFSSGVLPKGGEIEPLGITLCEDVLVEKPSETAKDRAKKVKKHIKSLLEKGANLSDIVVLSPWTELNEMSSLHYLQEEIDCRQALKSKEQCSESPREHFERWMKARRRGSNKVFGETIKGFKGLEAPYIILTDVESPAAGLDSKFTENDFYVGCTRARFELIIIPSDDYASTVLELSAGAD